jgi:replicative DNA helicase
MSIFTINQDAALPHNIEAESAIIGSMLVSDDAVRQVTSELEASDFYEAVHREIFEVVRDWTDDGRRPNALAIAPLLKGREIGGGSIEDYMRMLPEQAAHGDDLKAALKEVLTYAAQRQIIEAALDVANKVSGPKVSVADLAAGLISRVEKAESKVRIGEVTTISVIDAMTLVLNRDDAAINRRVVKTLLPSLDEQIGGLMPGELSVVGGRPGQGKSTFALQVAINAARAGKGVLYWSGEMSAEAMAQRTIASIAFEVSGGPPEAALQYKALRSGVLSQARRNLIHQATDVLRAAPLIFEQRGALTLRQLGAKVRQVKADLAAKGQSLDLIVVDYLGLLRAGDRYRGNRVNEVAEISMSLKHMARELDVHVMALHQVNRGLEGRDDKRPTMSDLKDSGQIEADADLILFCFREHYYLERSLKPEDYGEQSDLEAKKKLTEKLIDIIIAKQRMGQTSSMQLYCAMGSNYIAALPNEGAGS